MKAGTIFLVTTGEYSDYGIYATLRALCDFDFDATLKQWLAAHPDDTEEYGFSTDKFMSDLVLSGNVEEVTLPKLHVANYSTAQESPEADAHPKTTAARQWVRGCFDHTDCAGHPELGAACAQRTAQPSSDERSKP